MQSKIKDKVATRDSYHHSLPVGIKDYVLIINEFFKFVMELVLQGEEVRLPNGAGTVSIRGKKKKIRLDEEGKPINTAPNWQLTKKLWEKDPEAKAAGKKIYCLNEHTNGIRYTIHWCKVGVQYENQRIYALQFTKTNKRDTSSSIMAGKEYAVVYR